MKRRTRRRLAEVEDRERHVIELVLFDLEELVARVALQDLDQRLMVMASGDESAPVDDALRFPAQHGDLQRARPVRGLRVEAEEAALARDRSRLVEALDPHVVEIGGPVDRCARVRLRQVEEVRLPGPPPHLGRQLREAVGDRLLLGLAQDSEPRAGHRLEHVLALPRVQLVLAVAEEREVVVLHPLE
jgi:hypothetical protein